MLQTFCVLLLLIVKATQVSDFFFNVKLNMHLYTHSFILSMFIIFLIMKLPNYMVPEQN